VKDDLSNISNLGVFGDFTEGQKAKLSRNGFVVVPSDQSQMFAIYEQNVYWNLPNFVTTDVILHTYGDLYGYLLRKVEKRQVYGWVALISEALREESMRQYEKGSSPLVREAARGNVAYFAVAEAMMKGTNRDIPEAVREEAEAEIGRVESSNGRETCLVGNTLDYTEFKPRGHYAASDDWRHFFRTMNWYGQTYFDVPMTDGFSAAILQAQLMVLALDRAQIRGVSAWSVWDRITELTTLFSGPSNYITPAQCKTAMIDVYGTGYSLDDLMDAQRQQAFVNELRRLPPSIIKKELAAERQVRVFGKNFVFDTYTMQRLVRSPDRLFSSGLDVLAVLGFDRARALQGGQVTVPWYPARLDTLRDEVSRIQDATWTGSAYWGTLWTLMALNTDMVDSLPLFMNGDAWRDKTLNTACGSWAELRHTTILYTESFSSEADGNSYAVAFPKGYIEPNHIFFSRMTWLIRKLQGDLSHAGCLTDRMNEKLDLLVQVCDSCRVVVEKELLGTPLSQEDYRFIHFIGGKLAQITTGFLLNDNYRSSYERADLWISLPEGSKNQAVIADVGTSGSHVDASGGTCQEVGIGHPQGIFVVVPGTGGPRLTRGSVYQYYEFLQPARERLTDEEWRELLTSSTAPDVPPWCESYRCQEMKPGTYEYENRFRSLHDGYRYTFEPDD
jgi:hypothetical protein